MNAIIGHRNTRKICIDLDSILLFEEGENNNTQILFHPDGKAGVLIDEDFNTIRSMIEALEKIHNEKY